MPFQSDKGGARNTRLLSLDYNRSKLLGKMVPEPGKLKLYTKFLYHSSSKILHLHQSFAVGVAFYKTVKQSFHAYLLHTSSKRPLKMQDEDRSWDLSSSEPGRTLRNQDRTNLGSGQSCLNVLVQDCTVNHSPLKGVVAYTATSVLWHANHPSKLKRAGQKTGPKYTAKKKKHEKMWCIHISWCSGGQELTLKESLSWNLEYKSICSYRNNDENHVIFPLKILRMLECPFLKKAICFVLFT